MNTSLTTSLERLVLRLAFIVIAVTSFALLPEAQAVVPAPDGGYPGGNTAEGQNALLGLTTGGYNTAIGYFSLRSDTTGGFNTAIGAGALFSNTASENTAVGTAALLSNNTGDLNTATGTFALGSNTSGSNNTALGYHALAANSVGVLNTAVGAYALLNNQGGVHNVAVGESALINSTGNDNIGIGQGAGLSITGDNNICIGFAVLGVAGESNTIRIGNSDTQNCYLQGLFDTTPQSAVYWDVTTGKLGSAASSRRFKCDIAPMDKTSEAILALNPVTFHYKKDAKKTPCFGLIAEDVAKVNPDLVVHEKDGQIYSVRYDQINAMLLNEFLKEHKKLQQQQANIAELQVTVAQQRKGMDALTAQLKEQAAQIQKVSAQVEMNKPATEVVLNSH